MEKTIEINIKDKIEKKHNQFVIKRIFDIILSFIGITVLMPIYIIIAIAIKLDSKGPVLFTQVRVGKNSNNFIILKFRTMEVSTENKNQLNLDPENMDTFVFQNKSDSRITKVGRFLRSTSLDELPQLFNVFLGTMSLVGPRPEIPEVVKYYPKEYYQRLLVLPGITGLAQISGRGEIELGKTIFYDLTYINNFSLWFDVKILFETIFKVLKKEGAF